MPDDAAHRVQDDVEEHDRERDPLAHHAEQHEHVGDHHRREELEEVLDPQVHDPEAPELGGREVVAGAGDQADGVEGGDRAGGQEEQPRHVARVLGRQAPAQNPPEHEDPHEQADRQQDLPQASEVEVLEPLKAEPVRGGVLEHAVHAEVGADQRPEHDHGERAQQREGQLALVLGLAPGDHRRQEDAGRDERGGHPEQRELDVPGAQQVVREDLRQVEAEEVVDLGAVVLRRRADQGLQQEQRRHHEEEPRARALRGCEGDVARGAERERRLLAAVPSQPPPPAPEGAEQQPDAAQQRDERQHRPHDHVGGRLVGDPRLGRPVVGIGVVVTGTVGRCRPRRPGEEGGQLAQLRAVGDRVGPQPVLGLRVREERAVVRRPAR